MELRYRRAEDPVGRSHWQVIWLLAQGLPSAQVAAVTSYTVNWIRTLALVLQPDGKLVAAGVSSQADGSDFALVRSVEQQPVFNDFVTFEPIQLLSFS